MGVEIVDSSQGLLTVRVTGTLTKPEQDRMYEAAIEIIQRDGKVRFLVIAEDFQGWDEASDWGDISFQMKYDRHIEKIAIVGEEEWRDLAIAFVGKGFRPVAIEYFLPSEFARARAWVASAR